MDGLELYEYPYAQIRFNSEVMQSIAKMELQGRDLVCPDLDFHDYFTSKEQLVSRFLRDLEAFLALTSESIQDYTPFLSLGSLEEASCLWSFQHASCRLSAIRALKPLVNARGSTTSLAGLRSLTAVARILKPDHWATLSWRVMACVGFRSISHVRDSCLFNSRDEMLTRYLHVSDDEALKAYAFMESKLTENIRSVAQVSMALYNLSLAIWPIELPFDKASTLH